MLLRFAQKTDIPAIIALLRQVGQIHYEIRPDIFRSGAQKYDESALEVLLADSSRPIFIAEEDGQVLGYCFCILEEVRNDPVLTDSRTLYIDDLCVDANCRGQHVGRQLYDHACAYARLQKCQSVTLNVWCGNDSAMAFYQKRGMTPRKIYMETRLEENEC